MARNVGVFSSDLNVPGTHLRTCELLPAEYVRHRAATLYALAEASPAVRGLVGAFMSRHALEQPRGAAKNWAPRRVPRLEPGPKIAATRGSGGAVAALPLSPGHPGRL